MRDCWLMGYYPPIRVQVWLHGSPARPPVVHTYGPTPVDPYDSDDVNSRVPQRIGARAAEGDSGKERAGETGPRGDTKAETPRLV